MSVVLDATGKTVTHVRFLNGISDLVYPKGLTLKMASSSSGFAELVSDPLPLAEAWTGSGMPPVGTVCEYTGGRGAQTVKVLTHQKWADNDGGQIFVVGQTGDLGVLVIALPENFRPARTPEQIAADERMDSIKAMALTMAADTGREPIDREYDLAAHLYDNGYRKQATE